MDAAPLFVASLGRAVRARAAWLVAAGFTALLAVAAAAPYLGGMSALIEHRYEPGTLVANLDETFRADNRLALEALSNSSRATVSALALLAMLSGAFTAGGWLTLFHDRREGAVLQRFLGGGARFFGRFVRVWMLTLLGLTFVGWLVYGDPWLTLVQQGLVGVRETEEFVSERSAVTLTWIQDGTYALLFALVLVWADYTRTRLARHDGSSAFWAGLESLALLVGHPIVALRPLIALILVEALGVWFCARAIHAIQAALDGSSGQGSVLAIAVFGLIALAWRVCVRGARYAAIAETSRVLGPALPLPDPWEERPRAAP
jgi:hypothetical protein